MKIRNKKLVSGIVATFMAVMLTGVAFAFAAQGPLNFNGTASVSASLALAITHANAVTTQNGVVASVTLNPDSRVTATNGSGYRVANMLAHFDGIDQSVRFDFTVTNIGTMAAEIAPIVLNFVDSTSDHLVWSEYNGSASATLNQVLQPTQSVDFSFVVAFDAVGIGYWLYEANAEMYFRLYYGLPGSHVPTQPTPPGGGPIPGFPLPPALGSGLVMYDWPTIPGHLGDSPRIGPNVGYYFRVYNHSRVALTTPEGIMLNPLPAHQIALNNLLTPIAVQSGGYWHHQGSHRVEVGSLAITYAYEILITFGICPVTGANAVTGAKFVLNNQALIEPIVRPGNQVGIFTPFYIDLGNQWSQDLHYVSRLVVAMP